MNPAPVPFKELLEACPPNGPYSVKALQVLNAYQERLSPATMAVVLEALYSSYNLCADFRYGRAEPTAKFVLPVADKLRHAIALLNGTAVY